MEDSVVWTEPAAQALDEIIGYIAEHDPAAADRTIIRIVNQTAGLSYFPHLGRAGRIRGTRELFIDRTQYIVIYRVRERIEVLERDELKRNHRFP
ncbi:MAG: type II toxin-antitoxin system RelE/ParE family toxin [Pseudomonadota bacterium]